LGSSRYISCASAGCHRLSSSFVRSLDACMELLKIQRHWPDQLLRSIGIGYHFVILWKHGTKDI
jgi:hypothetical protein